MMARLVDMQATMYAEPDRTSTVIADLSQGEELRITDRPTSGDDDWITVALPDERRGYLPSGTKIDGVPIVELEQDALFAPSRRRHHLCLSHTVWALNCGSWAP